MATIDYKEKYEQAMERARQFIEKPYLEDSAGIVKYIFPELEESEDEEILDELIRSFEGEDIYVPKDIAVKCLKSVRDRIQLQQIEKWSEEDKKYKNIVYSAILNAGVRGIYDYHNVTKEDVKKWLDKNLRIQNMSKLSDGQIDKMENEYLNTIPKY